jgi:hypothetical protein
MVSPKFPQLGARPPAAAARAGLQLALAAILTVSCVDDGVLHPPAAGGAALVITYARTASAQAVAAADQARIVVSRADAVIHASVHALAPGEPETRIQITIDVESANETLDVLVELLEAGRVLARRMQTVSVAEGEVTTAAVSPDPMADNITMGHSHAYMWLPTAPPTAGASAAPVSSARAP